MNNMFCTIMASSLITIAALSTHAQNTGADNQTIDFSKGKWDASAWTPIRLIHQKEILQFTQHKDSISVGPFTDEQKKSSMDNALLMTDSKLNEGQIELTFTLSPQSGTAPGFFISPTVKDGVLQSGLCVFVASYTMAVWWAQADPATGKTNYTPLARLNRWSEPNQKHILRCRFAIKDKSNINILLQLDDSDVLMLQKKDLNNPVNSLVGIWGCHGVCDYHQFRIMQQGTLPWGASRPVK
jgi:hypothetical protein